MCWKSVPVGGGFAIYAATHYRCRITTTTISKEQYDLACERIAAAGLSNRITVLLEDYRHLTGQYDKLVSLEMIEAVGHEFFEAYFHTCSELLKPEGLMLLQAITIADQQYETAKRSVDFIQRHIFPRQLYPLCFRNERCHSSVLRYANFSPGRHRAALCHHPPGLATQPT